MVAPGEQELRPCGPIAAIGNFDGVHLGHQYLLSETKKFADLHNALVGAVVFEPHPRRYLRPDEPPFLLTVSAEREQLLRSCGVSEVFTIPFDAVTAAMSPREFVVDILSKRLGLGGVVTGAEFAFGAKRAGDADLLAEICAENNMVSLQVEPKDLRGEEAKIGSSLIRAALKEGDVQRAQRLLGRPWSVTGTVEMGKQLGQTIGFPTANIFLGELIEPKYGVYAISAKLDGQTLRGVANFGRRPTVGAPSPLLEPHLFDFNDDLYGRQIEILFHDFLRSEEKFSSVDALRAQIEKDVAKARALVI